MTLLFPDLNVWLALADNSHVHRLTAWKWRRALPENHRLVFVRHTQLGLLRLLTQTGVMGERTLTLGQAWEVYDRWLADPHVGFYPEPHNLDSAFREMTAPFTAEPAPKAVGDCFLLACADGLRAALVTFDRALYEFARQRGHAAVMPA